MDELYKKKLNNYINFFGFNKIDFYNGVDETEYINSEKFYRNLDPKKDGFNLFEIENFVITEYNRRIADAISETMPSLRFDIVADLIEKMQNAFKLYNFTTKLKTRHINFLISIEEDILRGTHIQGTRYNYWSYISSYICGTAPKKIGIELAFNAIECYKKISESCYATALFYFNKNYSDYYKNHDFNYNPSDYNLHPESIGATVKQVAEKWIKTAYDDVFNNS